MTGTYATPNTMGKVYVELVMGFSHAFAPQLLAASVEVGSARGSTTRSGTAMFMIDSILPIASGVGILGPNLAIFDSG